MPQGAPTLDDFYRSGVPVTGTGGGTGAAPKPAAQPVPVPSIWDRVVDQGKLEAQKVAAAFRTTLDEVPMVQDNRLSEAYANMGATLAKAGAPADNFRNTPSILDVLNPLGFATNKRMDGYNADAIFNAARARPDLFPNIPGNRAEFEKSILTRQGARSADMQALEGAGLGARLLGGAVASQADPANMASNFIGLGGAKSIGQAALRAGAMNTGVEAVQQPGLAGARQRMGETLTPQEAAANIAMAGVAGGVLGGGGKAIGDLWTRLRNPAPPPPEDFITGSLDGGPVIPPDVNATLRAGGVDPVQAQAMSPDFAAMAAERIARAQARGGAMGGVVPERTPSGRIVQTPVPVGDSMRAVPDGVPIFAAPEGNIRGDDAGGMAGLERKRAADSTFLTEAQKQAADDPLVREILDAPVSTQTKIRTLHDRLMSLQGSVPETPDAPPAPRWQAPTAEQAAKPSPNMRSRMIDITIQTESGGNPNAVSPKGARGLMQVMPGTERDPGFGIRPAADGSEAERARVGRDYLDAMMRRYDGDPAKAWAAYNAGPGALDGAMKKHGANWLDHMPAETRAYVAKNMRALGSDARPPEAAPYRMSAPETLADGFYSSFERVRRNLDEPQSPPVREDFQGFEKTQMPESPSLGERATGVDRMGRPVADLRPEAGGSTRPFRVEPGNDFWEARAQQQTDDAFKAAMDDLQRRWDERAAADAERARSATGKTRMENERTATGSDPFAQYRGKYDQRPHKTGETWSLTPEGYIAGKNGKPVAFRNSKEAARFAVREKLGGDFDRATWTANSERVVLKRRDGSTYGQAEPGPARTTQTDFEPVQPPAGRSADTSQRALPSKRPEDAPETQSAARSDPDPATAPYRSPARSDGPSAPPVERVVTPLNGREYPVRYEVREARDLVTSDRPEFNQAYQPRQRGTRAQSDAQIADIAARLDPEQLHTSRLSKQGAPIISPDGHVDSGNGRVAAIRRAYEMHPERAAAYREMIERKGFDTTGMDQPVLVRKHEAPLSHEDRVRFTQDTAARDDMAPAATETAKMDADLLDEQTLSAFRGGSVDSAANREFVRGWMEKIPQGERNPLMTPDGSISAEGLRRLQNALLARAYEDADLIARLIENPDDNIKNIGKAMAQVAPSFAALKERIAKGEIPADYDITKNIVEAAKLISEARRKGDKIGDVLRQADLDRGSVDPVTEAVVRLLYKGDDFKTARSAATTSEAFRRYISGVEKETSGPDLLRGGEPMKPLEMLQNLKKAMDGGLLRDLWEDDAGFASLDFILFPITAPIQAAKALFKMVSNSVDTGELKADFASIKAAVGDPRKAAADLTAPMRDMVSTVTFSNDSVMRAMAERFDDSAAINEWADHFNSRAGKADGTTRTYHEAVQRASTVRVNELHSALLPFLKKADALSRIRDLLTNPDRTSLKATAPEREAAGKIRDLLKETIDYRKAAGEDIGEILDGYFPRVIDPARVAANEQKFLAAAERLYRQAGVDDPAAAARQWFSRIYDQHLGIDGGLDYVKSGGGIGANSAKGRTFLKEADTLLKEFYNQDVFQTLASYFTGAARRAEETRRFGVKGAVDSPERAAWVKEHGDKTQLDVLVERVKADIKASGKDARDALHRLERAHDSNLGRLGDVSPGSRTTATYLHAWGQLTKLDRTLVTSLGEMTMGFVRGGPRYGVPFLVNSIKEFGAELSREWVPKTDAARWAEALGIGTDALVNQSLTSRIDAEHSTAGVQRVMAGFYQGIGIHQYTEGTRRAAISMGQKMLDVFAHDMASSSPRVRSRAARYLTELGVSDPAKFAENLRSGKPALDDVRRDKAGYSSDYATAVIRFVNQTIMTPSRAVKPAYASHPVGSLFYSLMGYSYGFKKNVLDRAGRMAADAWKDKDPALLMPAMMLPVLAAAHYATDTFLRPYIYGSNYDFSEETPSETLLRVADRAGFTGPMSPIINAFRQIRYQRDLPTSLAGPIVGDIGWKLQKMAEPFLSSNSENNNTAERNAAAALYDAVIEPAADALGAKYLRGAARTAAILSTGNKEGGVLPGDKSAFVDAVGGPEE